MQIDLNSNSKNRKIHVGKNSNQKKMVLDSRKQISQELDKTKKIEVVELRNIIKNYVETKKIPNMTNKLNVNATISSHSYGSRKAYKHTLDKINLELSIVPNYGENKQLGMLISYKNLNKESVISGDIFGVCFNRNPKKLNKDDIERYILSSSKKPSINMWGSGELGVLTKNVSVDFHKNGMVAIKVVKGQFQKPNKLNGIKAIADPINNLEYFKNNRLRWSVTEERIKFHKSDLIN